MASVLMECSQIAPADKILMWCVLQIPEQVVSEFARARAGSAAAAPIVKANLAIEPPEW